MTEVLSFEAILRYCAESAPRPWYPSEYARASGVPRDDLDAPLEKLRLGGLIHLTDWVKDLGQGYALTPLGVDVLGNKALLAMLKVGKMPKAAQPVEAEGEALPEPASTGQASAWDRGEAVREALLGAGGNPQATNALLIACVIFFLASFTLAARLDVPASTFFAPSKDRAGMREYNQVMDETGAISAEAIIRGQWWRLLTSSFVHVGLMHILFNMLALYLFGPRSERLWGSVRFLVIYLLAGVGGFAVALILTPVNVLIAGASCSLCGILVAEAAWVLLNRAYIPEPVVSAWLRNFSINAILIIFISTMANVSWQGHLGGAAAGLVLAVLAHWQRFGNLWQRWLALAGIVAFPVLCVGLLLWMRNNDPDWQKLKQARQIVQLRSDQHHGC